MSIRRPAIVLGVVVLAVAGVAAAGAFFTSRDDATLSEDEGPGLERPAGSEPRVTPGNVLLLYGDPAQEGPLRELATELAGPASRALQAAGQAVLVRRGEGLDVAARALTSTRRLDAPAGAGDPALRAFVEFWLGRDPGG